MNVIKYHNFGSKYLIEFDIYKILLKKSNKITLTIADNKHNAIIIEGTPIIGNSKNSFVYKQNLKTSLNQKCTECEKKCNCNSKGNWTVKDIIKKGNSLPFSKTSYATLREIICQVSPEDSNQLGPLLEDFIIEHYN